MAAVAPLGGTQPNAEAEQQKHNLQLALHTCNLQLHTTGLQVLTEEFIDIPSDDKPSLQKMLQAS